jgi:hypothetical protein
LTSPGSILSARDESSFAGMKAFISIVDEKTLNKSDAGAALYVSVFDVAK